MASNATITGEMAAAARGVLALIVGDRRAPQHFDFSQRGLVGSFIAFFAVTAVNAVLPKVLGIAGPGSSVFRAVAMVAILFVFQIGCSAIVLNQLKRLDGLIPYLVADNWSTFYVTLATTVLALFGLSGDIALVFVGILVIVIEINIARLIVTLSPLQIAMFLIAQLVGVSVGLILVGFLLPLSPAELEAIAASTAPA